MGKSVLVTGGARSGKSRFAEELARQRGGRVTYIATAEPSDAEMVERIARHRRQRPAEWATVEVPLDLLAGLGQVEAGVRVVLVDCLVLWSANRLMALGSSEVPEWWERVYALETTLIAELRACLQQAREAGWDLILVTNEVGLGLVPPTAIGRAFRDMLGRLNQEVAAQAEAVFLVTAGQAVELKRLAKTPEAWGRTLWSE